MKAKKMPGPGIVSSLNYAFKFRRNYIEPLNQLFAEYGDYVAFTGGPPVVALFHPEAVEHVLRKNHKNYTKAVAIRELRPVLGNGLLTSEGDEWRTHRQIIGPEFQHKKIAAFFPVMQRHLASLIADWSVAKEPLDVAPAISKTTYAIAGECFFGANIGDTSNIVYKSIETASEVAVRRMALAWNIPLDFPMPAHRRLRRAAQAMDEIVYRIIDERMQHPSDAHDVLSRLTKVNSQTGSPQLNRTQIRDEVMTLLLAGHETTGNVLSWTLYLLGQHPAVQDKLRDEIRAAVTGEIPELHELPDLTYTKMVIEESMRLFPPAAAIGRQAIAEDEIAGYGVAAHTTVNLAQWITHRHPEFWVRPGEFIPERFEGADKFHPYAYFPFAAGPRECIGKHMAMVETTALLAGMIRNFQFQLISDNVTIRPLITLRPEPGVIMKVSRVGKLPRLNIGALSAH
jgi:cytochrome P450